MTSPSVTNATTTTGSPYQACRCGASQAETCPDPASRQGSSARRPEQAGDGKHSGDTKPHYKVAGSHPRTQELKSATRMPFETNMYAGRGYRR